MALAGPKKKKLIKLIIILAGLVDTLLDHDEFDTTEERVLRLVGVAEYHMNDFDDNEGNWTTEQTALWSLVDSIANAHDPSAMEPPTQGNYEQWEEDLPEAISNL